MTDGYSDQLHFCEFNSGDPVITVKASSLVYIDKGHSDSVANALFIFNAASNHDRIFGCSLNLNALKAGQEPIVIDPQGPRSSLKDFFEIQRSQFFRRGFSGVQFKGCIPWKQGNKKGFIADVEEKCFQVEVQAKAKDVISIVEEQKDDIGY